MQEPNSSSNVVIGLHIPKCGGTTLLDRVRKRLPDHRIFQNTSIIENYRKRRKDFLQLGSYDSIKFVFGHTIHEEMIKFFGDRTVFLFTGLREPRQRMVSELRYMSRLATAQGRDSVDLEDYINKTKNPMCWFLNSRFPTFAGKKGTAFERAARVVEHFDHIYFTEDFDNSAKPIFDALEISNSDSISNQTKSREKIPAVKTDNLLFDIELYEYCSEKVARDGGWFPKEQNLTARRKFENSNVKIDELRDVLYRASLGEYRSWRCLDDVVAEKKLLLHEIERELNYYKSNM